MNMKSEEQYSQKINQLKMVKIFTIDGRLRAEVDHDYPFETPIKFEVRNGLTEELVWESELYNGHWSEYNYPDVTYPNAKLISNCGKVIVEYSWDVINDGDGINKTFSIWSKLNFGAKGIAIGTHDGTSGEWVYPVLDGTLEAYLVEASIEQYKKLVKNFRNHENAYPMLNLVTTDGAEYEFFEGGAGYTNSILESLTRKYESNVRSTKMSSTSLNNLIISLGLENELKWLHIDAEGIDADLIMSIDESRIKLPEIIIFETCNLSEDKLKECLSWLSNRGYKYKGPIGLNMIAHKF